MLVHLGWLVVELQPSLELNTQPLPRSAPAVSLPRPAAETARGGSSQSEAGCWAERGALKLKQSQLDALSTSRGGSGGGCGIFIRIFIGKKHGSTIFSITVRYYYFVFLIN